MKHIYKSGLKLISEYKFKENTSAFRLYVNIGSIYENPKEKGIAHLVEHLIFKSTKTKTTLEIAKELEMYGATINAYTNYDITCFHFTVLNDNFLNCIKIYSDMIFNKDIKQDEFEREKQVVIQELCMYQDLYDSVNEENYYKEYYGWDPIIGYRNILESITLEDVMNFIHKYYIPQNMLISTVSNYPSFIIKRIIRKYFADKNNDGVNTSMIKIKPKKLIKFDNKAKKVKSKSAQAQVFIAYDVNRYDPLSATYITYISNLCNLGLSSVFFEEVREKEGLCYGIHAETDYFFNKEIFNNYPSTFNVLIKTEVPNVKKVINKVDYVMNHLPELIDKQDIVKLKNFYKQHDITVEERAGYNARHFDDKKFISIDKTFKICKKMTLKKAKSIIIKCFTTKPKYKAMLLGQFKN